MISVGQKCICNTRILVLKYPSIITGSNHSGRQQDRSTVQLTDSGRVLRDIISRAYGCPVISLGTAGVQDKLHPSGDSGKHSHPNLLPCRVAVETDTCFILVHVSHSGIL